jgi:vitamin B12/bleomycin/antimicrobial peptide transport system ATP-binding/permease protein
MADDRGKIPNLDGGGAADSLAAQLLTMLRAFMASPQRHVLLMLVIGVALVVGATAFGQIELNAWNKPFYDALNRKDFSGFLHQLLVFCVIAISLLILNVAQTWLNQMMKLKLREGLVGDLFDQWLAPKRAFRLSGLGELGVNPDQRLHEDARHLTELSTDLGIGLFQASLLLISFIGVLWTLSSSVTFLINGALVTIPGYMVWCALLYAATGSWLSWRVGRSLIPLNAERYQRESDLRFALVRVNQHADGIPLYDGEADEKKHLLVTLGEVLKMMRRIVTRSTQLTWVTAGYGWFAIVVPIIVAAPGYFFGRLTLGELMMAAGAFTQVQQSLQWFVGNFNTIADWLATLRRVASFRCALVSLDELGGDRSRIKHGATQDGKVTIDHLCVDTSAGVETLSEDHVEIARGERISIVSDSSASLTALFRAIAGLWQWGSGSIDLPASEPMMFMPKHPYMPPGSLREILSYPSPAGAFRDEDLAAACKKVGLEQLAEDFERTAAWEAEVGDDELQRLALARLLLHKPLWICADEAIDALDENSRKMVRAIFEHDLREAGVIYLSRRDLGDGFSKRILKVVVRQSNETAASRANGGRGQLESVAR